jgi:hypothetical protein
MKNSVREELLDYAKEQVVENNLDLNDDELHFKLFNKNDYIIEYYNASEWLKNHNIGEFEAVQLLNDLMMDHFGEIHKVDMNSKAVVNQLVYFLGYEIMGELKEFSDEI